MRFKNRALIKILTALILIAVTLSIPLVAYAGDDYNGYQGDGNPLGGSGGASSTQSGYLAYIVDKNGNLVSDVAFLYYSGYYPTGFDLSYVKSAFGDETPTKEAVIDSSYPRPYTVTSAATVGQGTKLAEMLAKYIDGTDVSYAAELIGNVWGTDMMDEYSKGGKYLIMEGVWWIWLDKVGGSNTSTPLEDRCYAATAKGWAKLFQKYHYEPVRGADTYTNVWYRKLTHMTHAICMTFSQSMLGLDPACIKNADGSTNYAVVYDSDGSEVNVFYNSYILSDVAAGMIAVWKDGDEQSTDDETLSVPHTAPDESEDGATYQIVKNYVDKFENADGSITYTDAGRFVKTDSTNTISIEDETSNTGYTLVEWRATDSSDTSVESVNSSGTDITWQSNVPGSQPVGTTGEYTIDLEDDETILGTSGKTAKQLNLKTVYLLLLKSDEEEVEKEDGVNFTISESAVTRRVSFSEDENGITDLK